MPLGSGVDEWGSWIKVEALISASKKGLDWDVKRLQTTAEQLHNKLCTLMKRHETPSR